MENTTAPSVTTTSVGLRYGLLTGLVSVILSFILNATNLEQSPARWLSFVVLIGGIVLAHRFFKSVNSGYMSYGEGLGIGAIVSGVVGLLNCIFTYVYINFFDPEFLGRAMTKARVDMEARGGMSEEQIEQGMAMASKFMQPPFIYIGAIVGTFLFGFLLSLLISAITKNNRPEFE